MKPIDEAEAAARQAGREATGRNPGSARVGAEVGAATAGRTKSGGRQLMERVVERSNMQRAYSQVMRNRGAPGIDGLRTQDLKGWLQAHWQSVKTALLDGGYLPQAVRRVDIPKPQGGVRTLGVPTVVDRLIQQALARRGVLTIACAGPPPKTANRRAISAGGGRGTKRATFGVTLWRAQAS